MATFIEVLKDKVSRKQIIISVLTFMSFIIIIFLVGFFAAYVYNALYPRQSREIQDNVNRAFGIEQTSQKRLPNLNI